MGQEATAMYIIGIMDYALHTKARDMGTFRASIDVKQALEAVWEGELIHDSAWLTDPHLMF
jgi:hypothetical protein